MKYFYAYLPNESEKDHPIETQQIPSEHIYIDYGNDESKWLKLIEKLSEKDTLYVPSIENLSSKDTSIKERLQTLVDMRTRLSMMDDKDIDINLLLQFMDYLENSKREKAKELQRKGIEKALEKKYKGEGNFGRPKVEKPKDFKENILKIMRKELSHDAYRARLGMKRSTYYKLVKEEKDSWITGK